MSKKTINVNPMYLTSSNSKAKKQKKTRKTNAYEQKQTNHLRTKLLSKIKNHRQQQQEQQQKKKQIQNLPASTDTAVLNDTSEFDKSLNYLQGIVKSKTNKRKEKIRPSTIVSNQSSHVAETLQPPYSCLKNGSRPTYRTWKNTHRKPKLSINSDSTTSPVVSERSKQLRQLKEKHVLNVSTPNVSTPTCLSPPPPPQPTTLPPPPPPPLSPPPISLQPFDSSQKTTLMPTQPFISTNKMAKTTKKYTKFKLGKDGKRVGVLIKDRYTRKKIKEGHRQLKQKSIVEVKNYLKDHQLLKAGSAAPNDVLRATYEQAILAGEVNNKADDALMHNYLAKH